MKSNVSIFMVFLILGVFLVSTSFSSAGGELSVVAEATLSEKNDQGNIVHEITDIDSSVQTKDADGNLVNDISGLGSGAKVELDEKGNLKNIDGVVGEEAATMTINGTKYNIPAGTGINYKDGVLRLKAKKGGGRLNYIDKNKDGDDTFVNVDMPEGELAINKNENGLTKFSSKDPFRIYGNDGLLRVDVANFNGDNSAAIISLDDKGDIAGFSNVKLDFEGFGVSSEKETSFYYDKLSGEGTSNCVEQGSFLCFNERAGEEKIIFGSDAKGSGPTIEMNGENYFFNGDKNSHLEFSSESLSQGLSRQSPNRFTIEKDRVTVEGAGTIVNGKNYFSVDSDGNIFSTDISESSYDSMPMKIYSSKEGELGKYFSDVDENGVVSVSKVGFIEKGKYLYQGGGLYDISDAKSSSLQPSTSLEEIPNEQGVGIKSFSGFFNENEKVTMVSMLTVDGGEKTTGLLTNKPIAGASLQLASAVPICIKHGAECDNKDLNTAAKSLCSSAQSQSKNLYIVITTNQGRYSCGDKPSLG